MTKTFPPTVSVASLATASKALHGLLRALMALLVLSFAAPAAWAQDRVDYSIGPGDVVRIQVFQNTDLTVEARVSESGVISYPLLGVIKLPDCYPPEAGQLPAEPAGDPQRAAVPQSAGVGAG